MKIIINKNKKDFTYKFTTKGFTLVEVIFYIAIFVLFSVATINTLITMTKSFKETSISGDIINSSSILERISREIKQSYSISSISTNDLTVMIPNEVDALVRPVRFVLSGGNVEFYDNGVLIGNLNSSDVIVNNLTFTQITTTNGTAIKITLSVSSNKDSSNREYYFYNTIVLRGDY